jgi:hypothetical protein
MKLKKRAIAITITIIVLIVIVALVNILNYRIALLDSFPDGGGLTSPGYSEWKTEDRHIIRARISRLCFWPPRKITVTVIALGKDGKQPASTFFPQHGGTSIPVPLVLTTTKRFWHYYLPEGWPDCVNIIPWPPKILPGRMRYEEPNRNRYLETNKAAWVQLSIEGWGLQI